MPKKPAIKKSKKKDEEDDIVEPIEDMEEIDEENNEIEETEVEVDEPPLDEAEEGEEEDDFKEEDLKDENECVVEKAIEEDNEYFDNEDDIEVQPDTTVQYVKPGERISAPKLTKYEMVRILGERTKQLTMGAKPLVKNYQNLSYDKIAEEELKLNMIPFKIRRPLPNGKFELWYLEELSKSHLISLLE